MMIHVRTNYLISSADPKKMADAFKKIDFILSFSYWLDESTDLSDLVMPNPQYLERFNFAPNNAREYMLAGEYDWYYMLRQPVVEPPNGIMNWTDVLLEVANRIEDLREDYYGAINMMFNMEDPYVLDATTPYKLEEIADRVAKNMFGPEYGLEYMREKGYHNIPKRVEDAYPRPFFEPKTPIYLESYKRAGENVKKVTDEMGLDWWDVSDYQVLPDWKPCPSYECNEPGFDLWIVNFKVPLHTHSVTFNNPWLSEITERYPDIRALIINSETAKRKGLKDGDEVWLTGEFTGNRIRGVLKTTETIHPEVIGTVSVQGSWSKGLAKGKGPHCNSLIPYDWKYIDFVSLALDTCIKVKTDKIVDN
jgi:molybdopterin-containing oxidoreductase family molybdopterin binding subunit